nr:transketolase, chloroplastic-like [Ipomoea batatas]
MVVHGKREKGKYSMDFILKKDVRVRHSDLSFERKPQQKRPEKLEVKLQAANAVWQLNLVFSLPPRRSTHLYSWLTLDLVAVIGSGHTGDWSDSLIEYTEDIVAAGQRFAHLLPSPSTSENEGDGDEHQNTVSTSADGVEKGGYIISDNSGEELPEIILIGTGSELCLCEESAEVLRKEGRRVRVVSLVCWRLFERQAREYKELVLPSTVRKRVSVEAGSPLGWREYVGDEGVVIGIDEFGASGPDTHVFNKYGFTVDNVSKTARSLLSK